MASVTDPVTCPATSPNSGWPLATTLIVTAAPITGGSVSVMVRREKLSDRVRRPLGTSAAASKVMPSANPLSTKVASGL